MLPLVPLIASLFFLSFILSVILTPRAAAVAERFGLLDLPSVRKVHRLALPRIGGVAIFLAFFLSISCGMLFDGIRDSLCANNKVIYVCVGGILAFGLGFIDDIKQLKPKTKFAFQIITAVFAYTGGLQINSIGLPAFGVIHLGWLSIPATILWILIVINAINLIDGLDGLAAGVSFFVCTVLFALCLIHNNMMVAIILATLAGSILGFLIFNFNPASIFMGDSGSYFIGYMLAALSLLGSLKSQAAFTFLIPIIVLGVPLMDTIWATIRRFILGQKLFKPDKNHFHHKLLSMGYSHRRAVLILYGITLFLSCFALLMVNVANKLAALLLGLLAILVTIFIRRLGYVNFVHIKNILTWINDLANTLGINRDRRVFFAYQLAISEASNIQILTERIVATAQFLGLDYLEFKLGGQLCNFKKINNFTWAKSEVVKNKTELYAKQRLYMRFPLEFDGQLYGLMIISKKDFDSDKAHTQTLWRLEFLRRTITATLHTFKQKQEHEFCDRRVNVLGDRRTNEVKIALIRQIEERRRDSQDRRKPAPLIRQHS